MQVGPSLALKKANPSQKWPESTLGSTLTKKNPNSGTGGDNIQSWDSPLQGSTPGSTLVIFGGVGFFKSQAWPNLYNMFSNKLNVPQFKQYQQVLLITKQGNHCLQTIIFTARAKIEPTPLGSISYKGEKSGAIPKDGSYGQFQKYASQKVDLRAGHSIGSCPC